MSSDAGNCDQHADTFERSVLPSGRGEEAMKKGIWVRSDIEVNEGETLYFFHPVDGGGGQAYVAMGDDGTLEFRGDHRVVVKRIGRKERVFVKNAADLVI